MKKLIVGFLFISMQQSYAFGDTGIGADLIRIQEAMQEKISQNDPDLNVFFEDSGCTIHQRYEKIREFHSYDLSELKIIKRMINTKMILYNFKDADKWTDVAIKPKDEVQFEKSIKNLVFECTKRKKGYPAAIKKRVSGIITEDFF